MNKRIMELAIQSNLGPCCESQAIAIKKFAELIVQECCEISDKAERAESAVFASKFIKKHFGVEE